MRNELLAVGSWRRKLATHGRVRWSRKGSTKLTMTQLLVSPSLARRHERGQSRDGGQYPTRIHPVLLFRSPL